MQCDSQSVRCRFWLFQRQIYAKYAKNQQCDGRSIDDDINKIVLVKYSMHLTYRCES